MNWTREDFLADRERYQRELDALLAAGYADPHPLVERQRRRIETVDWCLADPAYGLTAVPVPHPTCIDVTSAGKPPRSEWVCGPECPADVTENDQPKEA